jgi:cell shape-determining protein MreD
MAVGSTMKKVFIVASLSFLLAAFWQAAALMLPYGLNILCIPPIIIAFTLQFFKPLETIGLCIITGAIVDSLGGFALGVNMALMLLVCFFLGATNILLSRVSLRELSIYVVALSLLYRMVFFVAIILIGKQKINISFSQFLLGPIIDMIISYVFYRLLTKILIACKALERSDFPSYGSLELRQ